MIFFNRLGSKKATILFCGFGQVLGMLKRIPLIRLRQGVAHPSCPTKQKPWQLGWKNCFRESENGWIHCDQMETETRWKTTRFDRRVEHKGLLELGTTAINEVCKKQQSNPTTFKTIWKANLKRKKRVSTNEHQTITCCKIHTGHSFLTEIKQRGRGNRHLFCKKIEKMDKQIKYLE